MRLNQRLSIAVLAIATLLTSACGFHLRGSEQMELDDNLKTLYLNAIAANSDLVRTVRNALENSGATIVGSQPEAPYGLFIGEEKERVTTVSVGAAAQATSKNLVVSISYTLMSNKGAIVMGPEEIRVEKLVQYNVLAVNASDREMDIARSELRRKLAMQIVRQMRNLPISAESTEQAPTPSAPAAELDQTP